MALGGGSKSFKTWTLWNSPSAFPRAGSGWAFDDCKGKVLYVNFELPAFAIEHRVQRDLRGHENPVPENLTLLEFSGHAADAAARFCPRSRGRQSGRVYSLIILDPLYKLLGARDENASPETWRIS